MNKNFEVGRKLYFEKLRSGQIVKQKGTSLKKAALEKCKDCMADYIDGRIDCELTSCSLYYWMPYGMAKKNREKL